MPKIQHLPPPTPFASRRVALPGVWSRRYPILLSCLISGRRPTDADLAELAARIRRDLGPAAGGGSGGARTDFGARALAAARIALEGQPVDRATRSQAVVPRGH